MHTKVKYFEMFSTVRDGKRGYRVDAEDPMFEMPTYLTQFDAISRRIHQCQGFALRITKLNPDGTKSITTNAPCDIGSSTDLCMIQVRSVENACEEKGVVAGLHSLPSWWSYSFGTTRG